MTHRGGALVQLKQNRMGRGFKRDTLCVEHADIVDSKAHFLRCMRLVCRSFHAGKSVGCNSNNFQAASISTSHVIFSKNIYGQPHLTNAYLYYLQPATSKFNIGWTLRNCGRKIKRADRDRTHRQPHIIALAYCWTLNEASPAGLEGATYHSTLPRLSSGKGRTGLRYHSLHISTLPPLQYTYVFSNTHTYNTHLICRLKYMITNQPKPTQLCA